MLSTYQNIVLPGLDINSDAELYLRCLNQLVVVNYENRKIKLLKGGLASFDTFFNGLSLGKLSVNVNFTKINLNLTISGKLYVRIYVKKIGNCSKLLSENFYDVSDECNIIIEINKDEEILDGMLYFVVQALDESALYSGEWSVNAVKNSIKLGVVITHFNRQKYVLPAIDRIRNQLLCDENYKDKIELVIVDNSQNIGIENTPGITVIPNKNYGGAGGFTRGLLFLKDKGDFTHCLFMDDDASCEVDSIRRAFNYLNISDKPNLAIAGSLLRDVESYRLFEKGAKFDGIWKPLKTGLDMRNVDDLIHAEIEDVKADYGGWWFFAFRIQDVKHYAFPFFVRGDDIQFSLLNKFNIVTINGINCWAEDFGYKSGPLPIYLDVRNHLVQKMAILNSTGLSSVLLATRFFLAALFSYNYATAKAVTLAVRDVMEGERFWLENMDMRKIRSEIQEFSGIEKMQFVDRFEYKLVYRAPFESNFRKLVRLITMNGFLLPNFMLREAVAFQHKNFRASLREVFRFKYVLFEYEPKRIGYIAKHDKKAFFTELLFFFKIIVNFYYKYGKIKAEYKLMVVKLTSEDWWRSVYR